MVSLIVRPSSLADLVSLIGAHLLVIAVVNDMDHSQDGAKSAAVPGRPRVGFVFEAFNPILSQIVVERVRI